jgi:hypothetical protein
LSLRTYKCVKCKTIWKGSENVIDEFTSFFGDQQWKHKCPSCGALHQEGSDTFGISGDDPEAEKYMDVGLDYDGNEIVNEEGYKEET